MLTGVGDAHVFRGVERGRKPDDSDGPLERPEMFGAFDAAAALAAVGGAELVEAVGGSAAGRLPSACGISPRSEGGERIRLVQSALSGWFECAVQRRRDWSLRAGLGGAPGFLPPQE